MRLPWQVHIYLLNFNRRYKSTPVHTLFIFISFRNLVLPFNNFFGADVDINHFELSIRTIIA